jgi:hypothetical protein
MRFMYLKSFAALLALGLSSAAFGQAAVDTLKYRMVNQSVTVNLPELRLSKLPHAEVRIVNGVAQKRLLNLKLDTDEVIPQNSTVRVTKVVGEADKKSDYLRVTVRSDDGATATVAFVKPLGGLAAMDEAALEQLIAPAFGLLDAGGGAPLPADQKMAEIPPPPPPPNGGTTGAASPSGWRIQTGQGGQVSAAVAGTMMGAGRPGPAVLSLSCSTVEVRIRRNQAPKLDAFSCDSDATDPQVHKDLHFSVGGRSPELGSVCIWIDPEATAPAAVTTMTIDLGATGTGRLVASPGAPLSMIFDIGSTAEQKLTAQFQLPQDASPISFLSQCKRSEPTVPPVTSCPDIPGKGLRKAEVVTAAGKPFKGSPGDFGVFEWTIPPVTKAHPVRPKLSLACYYGVGEKQVDPEEPLEKKLIPMSERAATCDAIGDPELGEFSAHCSAKQ